jgi:2-methylcitrate dehydratase PrpD
MHYSIAAALLDGEVTLKQFTDEKVTASKAQDLMSKVKLVELETEVKEGQTHSDPPQIIRVKLHDGKVILIKFHLPRASRGIH